MGEDVAGTGYTREQRQRYREKVRQNLDVFEQMLAQQQLRLRAADDRAGDRAQPGRRRLPAPACPTPRCWSGSPTRTTRPSWAATTSSSTCRRGRCRATPRSSSRTTLRTSLNHAEALANQTGAHIVAIGILPTADARALQHRVDERQPPLRRRSTRRSSAPAARTCSSTSRGRRGSGWRCTPTPSPPSPPAPSVQLHLQVAPQDFAAALERRAGARRPAAGAGRELAVLLRQAALGRDPGRAVPAGHRHPLGGAEEPGRAPAGVLRRALDHLDLRPVRGERALLPGAAAGDLRRGPGGGAGRRQGARGCRSCGCTTARSTAGTARSTTSSTARPHLRVENRVLPAGPTIVDVLANAAFYYGVLRMLASDDRPVWTKMSFAAAEHNFQRVRPPGHRRRASTGPGSARSRPTSWSCGTCCRWPTRGSSSGASPRRCATATSGSSRAAAPRA